MDDAGNFYFTHKLENKISKYSPEGKLVKKIGGIGRGPGEYEEGRVILINIYDNNLIAHSYGGINYNEYTLNLDYQKSYTSEKLITSVIKNNNHYLLTYYLSDLYDFIELRNSNNNILSINSLLKERNKFFRNLYKIIRINDNEYYVVYLAVNKVFKLNVHNSTNITNFQIPILDDRSPVNKNLSGDPPSRILIRDATYDSHSNRLFIVEGDEEEIDGSCSVHVISNLGKDITTYDLPYKLDLIKFNNGYLFGISFLDDEVLVLKINGI